MRVLFAISVLCLCAVLWVAVSVARHALATRRRRRPGSRSQEGLVEVFFDDKMEQIREHAAIARQAVSTVASSPWMPAAIRQESAGLPPARSLYQRPPAAQFHQQPVAPPVASSISSHLAQPVPGPAIADVPLLRKAPQPVSANGLYRADWDYFNKDLGDLTDPYENALRDRSEPKSGTRY